MKVNQKQIAEHLGVSIALVSRVLSGKAEEIGIATATRDRVLKTAREMGYVPSAAALSLKGKSTKTLGVVVYNFNDPYFGSIIEHLQGLSHDHCYSLVMTGFRNRIPDLSDLSTLYKHAIDGVIILGSDEKAEWLDSFEHLPVARIGHGHSEEKSTRIAIDEDDAASQLINYLYESGRRKLTFLARNLPAHHLRYVAMKRHAERVGCSFEANFFEDEAFESGKRGAEELLNKGVGLEDALVCATDVIAMGALHALNINGKRVAITGFDDIPAASRFFPSITTIRQPIGEMVKKAFLAVTQPASVADIQIKGDLLVRSSS
ncbi:MAG TPA: LacI family DNA-binding transcriptional regulator [Pontiella sp.]